LSCFGYFAKSINRLKNRGWGQAEHSAIGGIQLKDQEDCARHRKRADCERENRRGIEAREQAKAEEQQSRPRHQD
jgi:hypothetical protein